MTTTTGTAEDTRRGSAELSGLPSPPEQPVQGPLSAKWITAELLERTRQVWSVVYGREISADEAVEILINVRNLAEVLLDIENGREGL